MLFFHDSKDSKLLVNEKEFLNKIISRYPISTLGVSVYNLKEIDFFHDCSKSIALQFPLNVLDRRFEKLNRYYGTRYARSIFLQGILASESKLRKNSPSELLKLQAKYHNQLKKYNFSPINFAVSYVVHNNYVDYFCLV